MKRRYPKKVGEILIEKGLITLDQLTKGLAEQSRHGTSLGSSLVRLGFVEYKELESVLASELQKVESIKIGEILLENKVITQDQLSQALKAQRGSDKLIGEVLIDMEFLNQGQLTDALSIQFDVKHVAVDAFLFKPDVVALLDAAAAQKYRAIPLRATGRQLMLATDEPFNLKRIQTLEKITKMTIEPVYADAPQLDAVIRREYGIGEFKTDDDRPPDQADASEAEKKAALVLTQAIAEGASFIHLDPSRQNLMIRFRIDGQLHPQSPLRPRLGVAFTDYLKAMAKLDPLNRRSIQTGYFSFKAEGGRPGISRSRPRAPRPISRFPPFRSWWATTPSAKRPRSRS
jgi:type IV pilus assembly protein PilB